MTDRQVLIAGAGPTGLVLAIWLTKLGVPVRIVDKLPAASSTSRALAVHARTLELYSQVGLTEAVLEKGHKTPGVRLWVSGQEKASISFDTVGQGLTPYPFLHIYPQDEHERLLIARLEALGVRVERGVEVLGFAETVEGLTVRLKGPDGVETTAAAAYLAGCDGARSAVRHGMGVGYPGGTYRQLFYVADVEAKGPPMNGDLNLDLEAADFLAIFPLDEGRRARLIGTVREDEGLDLDKLKFDDVSDRAIRDLKVEVTKVNWFSTYHVHHRVTERFRGGRAFLLGDAAHIHSPAGGQGMNTGIGDAINLAWKLAAVLAGRAPEALLDSYEAERRAFAVRLVRSTDQGFRLATAEGPVADLVRTRLVPLVLPAAAKVDDWREFAFRTVSQITLNYRHQPISAGRAGEVHGGDRLPWIAPSPENGGRDNFAPLARMVWQVHVYGEASPALTAWCAERGLPLEVFAWSPACATRGLKAGAAYLLRPDTYVALADPSGSPKALEAYFARVGIRP
ncbi:MAG TPA: FAD-dependent monooxygenase [Phenylobacterium sp.]|jgi:2-polyprenyl-6-methoxyphenol hydroxylase-like FAD-dependent oxidoreductase|uniref:FAD-dependent monooxygenase n=1 Tax=Phenylobacterium sp. TaxID=1871053 RepID=UPI002D31F3F2|nr:FAD-dependent monooxygenase [Phenylobacterium sp.]HZZ69602.1 FAD-dependent monooxygenase [Phenylobacterium sp.]